MSEPVAHASVQDVAQTLTDALGRLPPGIEVFAMVMSDEGGKLSGTVISSMGFGLAAPMLHEWLRRYEAGEIKQEGHA